MSAFDDRPPRAGVVLTGVFSLGVVLTTGFGAIVALVGGLALVAATHTRRRVLAGVGAVCQLLGLLAAGTAGAGPVPILAGMVLSIAAWDTHLYTIDLARTLGRATPTRRLLAVHLSITVLVATLLGATGYVIYSSIGNGYPIGTVLSLFCGAVVLLWLSRG
ncbi:DUF7519 family protein [Halocatena halophila]|uniref:DUF7519 family protein n=1 Tax=Halocatena halophila TaxID=2814576 RepID=UPI002ED53A4D